MKQQGISPFFTQALVATEDSRFYDHHGVDLTGIGRALASNLSGGSKQGASTITQQVVKNILVNSARDATEVSVAKESSYLDKLREAKYAVALEQKMTKDQILTLYANTVYFGNGSYGVEAASLNYFNVHAKDLTRTQAATLVGILRGPTQYDPVAHPDAALNRRNTVLSRMASTGKLSPAEAGADEAQPLGLNRGTLDNGCGQSAYPFYCALVHDEILNDPAFGATREEREDRLTRGGMTLTTALDPVAMQAAQDTVTNTLGNDNRAALGVAVVKPGTGQITAIAENRAWGSGPGQTQIVYAQSLFQPGSSIKPVTLATALEQGIPVTTRLNADSPYTSSTLDSPPGGFQNYGGYSYGVVDAREAIKMSLNTYFVRLIERTGVLPVADMAARLGITSIPRTGPDALKGTEAALTLGAYEVTPIQMANAYAVFDAHGTACAPHAITSGVRSATGEKIRTPDPDCHQAIAPAVADTVADTLKQPFTTGGTLGAMGGLTGREAAAKTGTTNDFAANWIVGFTPQLVTSVWLGDPRGGSAHPLDTVQAYGRTFHDLTGAELAGPVWKDIMNRALVGQPALPLPKADNAATSTPTVKSIPDVRGLTTDAALTLLEQNGLTSVIAQATAPADNLHPPGVVAAQTPSPGGALGYKQEVTVTLSAGSDTGIRPPQKK